MGGIGRNINVSSTGGAAGDKGQTRGGTLATKRSTPRSDSGSIGGGGGMLRRGSSNVSIVAGSPSVLGRALGFVRGIVEDALVSKSTTETPVVTSSSSSSSQSFENISFQVLATMMFHVQVTSDHDGLNTWGRRGGGMVSLSELNSETCDSVVKT